MKNKLFIFFKYVSEYSLYGLLFFLAISNALVEIFVVLTLVGFIGRKIIKPDFRYLKFWPNIFLLVFLLFSALSLFNSGVYLNKSINALFGKWMQYLGIYIIVQDTVSDKRIFKRAIFVFLASASLVLISGLSQYFLGFEFLRGRSMGYIDDKTNAMTASFAHYNNFGAYILLPISLAVSLLLSANSFGLGQGYLFIFTIFSTLALALTFSRGSWLSAIAAFIFISFASRKNLKRLISLVILVAVISLFPMFRERFMFIFRPGGDSDRFRYWVAALKMIKLHPFLGIGVGTFMANFSEFLPNTNVSYAHNCYLQIFAETGIFSLLAFLAFIGSFIFLGIKKFIISRDYYLLGLLTGAVGYLVHSFFDTHLYSLNLAVLFWTWTGLIFARLRGSD